MSLNLKSKVQCPRGYDAVVVCRSKSCSNNPLLCNNKDCNCLMSHQNCFNEFTLQKLDYILNQYASSCQQLLTSLLDWCQNGIKQFLVLSEEIKRRIQHPGQMLSGNQQKLYFALKQGRSQDVTKQLVMSVTEFIQYQMNSIKTKLKQFNKQLENDSNAITNSIQKLRQICVSNSQKPIKFSVRMHHPSISLINDNTVQMDNGNGNWKYALLQPAIENRKRGVLRFRFKIIKTKESSISFGICHKQTIVKNQFIWKKWIGGGFYYIFSPFGTSCSHSFQQQNWKPTQITSINEGEAVQIAYDQQRSKMTVTNLSKNQSAVISIRRQNNNPLHLGINMRDTNDIVEYLGQFSDQ